MTKAKPVTFAPRLPLVPATYLGRVWHRLTRCWWVGHEPDAVRPHDYGPGRSAHECVWCGLILEDSWMKPLARFRRRR